VSRFAQTATANVVLLSSGCYNEARMNLAAQYWLAIVLCAVMTPLVKSSAVSDAGHSKHSPEAALETNGSAGAGEGKWEHDPIVFSPRDRNAIRNYYRGTSLNLPPGLAKRNGNLPPGLRKRNGMLPPGLQKRIQPLPGAVEHRLQALDSGYSRGMLGEDVVIVEDRTQRIMDIIRDVTERH
jgi:hypothetical protein